MEKTPKLEQGMVVEFKEPDAQDVYGYLLILGVIEKPYGYAINDDLYSINIGAERTIDENTITRVFRAKHLWPTVPEFHHILGSSGQDTYLIWERPRVREMTVDEISKKLGYPVKIIGNEKGETE